jgi:hypothetical protein
MVMTVLNGLPVYVIKFAIKRLFTAANFPDVSPVPMFFVPLSALAMNPPIAIS